MKVLIGSDKSGFGLKEEVKAYLTGKGYEMTDCGTLDSEQPKPFFEAAPIAAQKIQSGEFERAILICGTGMGMAIVANKFEGVYAACCESTYAAKKCRAINDANILTMGGWIIAGILGCEMAETFLTTGFTENLEEWRQEFLKGAKQKVGAIEESIYHKDQ